MALLMPLVDFLQVAFLLVLGFQAIHLHQTWLELAFIQLPIHTQMEMAVLMQNHNQ